MAKQQDFHEGREPTDEEFNAIPHVKARYRCAKDGRQRESDYAAALPALATNEQIQASMTSLPPFQQSDRELSTAERILLLNNIDDIFFATSRHVNFVRAALRLINQGYAARSKQGDAEANGRLQQLYDRLQSGAAAIQPFQRHKANQFSMCLCGPSGGGKSITMKRLRDLLPPAIYHEKSGKWQLPVLLIEMAYDGESVHTLASALFDALDDLLPGENYAKNYMYGRSGNGAIRAVQALKIARHHGVGLILIDETQNQRSTSDVQSRTRRRKASTVANIPRNETPLVKLLITASNEARMPICFTGTLEAQNVIGRYFPRGRRMAGRGSAMWLPLEPSFCLEAGKRGEFEQAMTVLWRYQWIRKPSALTPEMLDIFWNLTMGLPDVMVKLFSSAQEAAMVSKDEALTKQILLKVYDDEFWAVHLGLEALREGDPDLCEAFPEIWHPLESPKFRERWLRLRRSFRRQHNLDGYEEDVLACRMAQRYTQQAQKRTRRQLAEQSKAARLQADVEDFDPADRDAGADARESLLKGENPAGVKQKGK